MIKKMRTIEDLKIFGVIENKYLSVNSLKDMAVERYKEYESMIKPISNTTTRRIEYDGFLNRMIELKNVFNLTDEDLK